jgi:cytidylate kinase
MISETFFDWESLLDIAPREKPLAMIMILHDKGFTIQEAIDRVSKMSEQRMREVILENRIAKFIEKAPNLLRIE